SYREDDLIIQFKLSSVSSSKLSRDQTSNPTSSLNTTPKGRIRRSSKQKVENSNFEEHLPPMATMDDNRTMAEMLRAPTEGCAEAIMVSPILAEQFELKHSLINMMTSEQFFRLEKDNLHYHIRWGAGDQDSLNAAAGGNLLEKSPQDALTIIENKSKQTSVVTTAMTAMPKQLQANPHPAPVKAIEETCITCGAARNYNQNNPGYRPQGVANQMRPPGSGSLLSNTVANPKGELKAITTRSGLVTDGPTVPTPPKSVTPEMGERVEETYMDPDLVEYTIKFPPPPVQKYKPPELKCKALADSGASINLIPLSVWKEFGLPELIPTRMTLELANRAICTPVGIARDVFVPVGKFTFPADFVVVDYESDPRVPLVLGRPSLRTAFALIDVHGEEMILCDGEERLTLNMKHDTTSYSNHPQKESVNLINIFNVSKGCNVLSEKLPDIDSINDIYPHFDDDPLSGSTTYFSNSLLEEFTDELALITYPPDYNDNLQFDIDSDLKEIEFLLYQGKDSSLKDSIDQTDLANLDDYFVDPIPEMFTDEHTPDYSSPLIFDVYDDDFLEVEFDADNVYDDPFDSNGEKIKESKLLIDELDLPFDFLPYSEYDSFTSQDFSRVDALPLTNNEDKVFNLVILIHEKPVKIITRVVLYKKLAISYASLVFEDFDPPFYEPLFFKDVPKSKMLLLFSSENEEKVFKPGIYTFEKVHSYFLLE
nr:reverse transcriptase domain-containing protein [Tanacetum cinerariifolium]